MNTDTNTHFRIRDFSQNIRRSGCPPITPLDWDRHRVLEIQKARCRSKIRLHTENVILQSLVSLLCVVGGIYAGQKNSIVVPLILAPTGAAACSKLAEHETKRRRYKGILKELERE